MYGLEASSKKQKAKKFVFDLELDIKKTPSLRKKIITKTKERSLEIKKWLNKGSANKTLINKHKALLDGYEAIDKVVNKI